MILKLFYAFLAALFLAFYIVVPLDMNVSIMSILLVVVLVILITFSLRREKNTNLKGQYLKHSSLFLVGFTIVHFQYYLDFVLGYTTTSNTIIWVNTAVVLKSMILSIIGLLFFLLGYLLFLNYKIIAVATKDQNVLNVRILVFLAFLALITFLLTVNPLYLLGYYGQADIGKNAAYAILVFEALVYAVIIQNCRNMISENKIPENFKQYIKFQSYFFVGIVFFYLFIIILSGDRGPLMSMGLCIISGYFFVTKNKLTPKTWMILIFSGAAFITLLGKVRSLDRDISFSDRLEQTIRGDVNIYEENSISPNTQELASSVKAFHLTVDYIPNNHDYLYGRFQFQELVVMIPFFSVFSNVIFSDHHYKYEGSSKFITWINQGEFPLYGNGTTCLSDFYFDFGLFGIVIGMFLFGILIRYCEMKMYNNGVIPNLFVHSLMVVYLSFAIYIARSSVLMQVKLMSLIFLILVFNKYILNKNKKNPIS